MKPIKLSDETYWMLRDMREKMSKDSDKQVTFDDVIQRIMEGYIAFTQGE